MGWFDTEQIKQLRKRLFTLAVIGLATAVALLSVMWYQGNAKGLRSEAPLLTAIVPKGGPAGPAYPLQATIHGRGFMPTGNVVEFGPVQIAGLPSANGNEITFAVPKSLPSRGEVPPPVLPPGEYNVRVTTSGRTSNALIFILTP